MSIKLENVFYTYQSNVNSEVHALENITLEIKEGDFIGLIGHTGSGKSTLVQQLNGLLKPTKGNVTVDEINIVEKGAKIKAVRQKVGLVFQYPEHQIFEESVYADIAFGPKNLGLPSEKVAKRVKKAMKMVHLDFENYKEVSPFVLSGGEKRRVAIAGVLAMEPKYLILDEPTAGLDPRGRDEILDQIVELHHQEGLTVVLVSHSMDDVARLVNRLVVMHKGKIFFNDKLREVFKHYDTLQQIGLDIPTVTKLMIELQDKGWSVRTDVFTIDEAQEELLKVIRGRKNA